MSDSEEDGPMDEGSPLDPVAGQLLDGNAVAGVLASVFGIDVTTVPGRCAHCGTISSVGALRAYVRAPGSILRCPVCDGIVLRVVETDEATYIDARGAAYLRFERR